MKISTNLCLLISSLSVFLASCGAGVAPTNRLFSVQKAGSGSGAGSGSIDQPSTQATTPLWESKHPQGREWTAHVMSKLDTLGSDMLEVLPSDYKSFCPRYTRLSYSERKQFWTYLMSAMVRFESNFKPSVAYRESFPDANGKRIVSRGLLQISIESSKGYACGFASEQELHDPFLNLSCGIRILNRWVARDQRIAGKENGWKGGARYWSVLRTRSGSYKSILQLVSSTSLCAI